MWVLPGCQHREILSCESCSSPVGKSPQAGKNHAGFVAMVTVPGRGTAQEGLLGTTRGWGLCSPSRALSGHGGSSRTRQRGCQSPT